MSWSFVVPPWHPFPLLWGLGLSVPLGDSLSLLSIQVECRVPGWLISIFCPPGPSDCFRSGQVAHHGPITYRCANLLQHLGKKHLLFSGVGEQLECKSESDRGLHVVRAFLQVKLTGNKVEPRDGGKQSWYLPEPWIQWRLKLSPVLFSYLNQ